MSEIKIKSQGDYLNLVEEIAVTILKEHPKDWDENLSEYVTDNFPLYYREDMLAVINYTDSEDQVVEGMQGDNVTSILQTGAHFAITQDVFEAVTKILTM